MDASIIVCTYNRAESLAGTLEALKAQQVAPGRAWEVIVVDNNSTVDTRETVTRWMDDWPELCYEFEGQQGLSHARNRGIASARGAILLFTDDDVLPEPDWMETILQGMAEHQAQACGGYIAPIWEASPPAWLTERFHGFLAVRMDMRGPYVLTENDPPPYGANMAFRREAFEKVGVFDINRGRKGAVLASGEDGEMFERLQQAGLKTVWLPGARVHHKVEAFRLEKRYLRRWRYQNSRNLAQMRGVPGQRRILGVPPYLMLQTVRALSRWAKAGYRRCLRTKSSIERSSSSISSVRCVD